MTDVPMLYSDKPILFNSVECDELTDYVAELSHAIERIALDGDRPELVARLSEIQDGLIELMKIIEQHTEPIIPLTPSPNGRDCLGNGQHDGIEIQCEDCPHIEICCESYGEDV